MVSLSRNVLEWRLPMLRAVAALALVFLVGCSPPDEDGAAANSGNSSIRLSLVLEAEEPVITPGGSADFSARLVNDGSGVVSVVLPGDGSSDGWRTPVIGWNPPDQGGRFCGNINALVPDEIVDLAPGQSVELVWLGRPTFKEVGTYQVTLEYEHVPDRKWHGIPLGEHDPAAMRRVREVPAIKLTSNAVEIQVRESVNDVGATPMPEVP
jgi:hypothetical protein